MGAHSTVFAMHKALFKKQAVAPEEDGLRVHIPAHPVDSSDEERYRPGSWEDGYTSKQTVTTGDQEPFQVYWSNPERGEPTDSQKTLFVLLHGAGHSALSW